jgi:hypothetical protein
MKLCSFEGCNNKHCAKGLCGTHWAQQNRQGKLSSIKTSETPEERFNRNIKKEETTGCWIWLGAGSGKFYNKEDGSGGYGMLRIKNLSFMAHRWAYEQKNKIKLSSEDTLDHICRNTRCVNPEHLEKVTLRENVKRMHLYHALQSENRRLKEYIKKIGHDPDRALSDINEIS